MCRGAGEESRERKRDTEEVPFNRRFDDDRRWLSRDTLLLRQPVSEYLAKPHHSP